MGGISWTATSGFWGAASNTGASVATAGLDSGTGKAVRVKADTVKADTAKAGIAIPENARAGIGTEDFVRGFSPAPQAEFLPCPAKQDPCRNALPPLPVN